MMYKYTLCFIKNKNQLLMINRNKSPWMGCWNGLGGKIEDGEKPDQCIKREIMEEERKVLLFCWVVTIL